jgi:tripartite-type tricarboxylate transporter receptor subunit TctC
LVALAKSKPGTLNFASSSVGSLSHFAGEMLKQIAGIDIVHVPYKGGGPAMLDVLSGQVPIYFSGVNAALGYIQSGKLRALGVTSKDRVSILADVPPLAETPELKNYEASIKFALWGPAKMPAKIIEKLNASAVTGLRSPEIQEYLKRQGSSPAVANTPQEMAADLVTIEKTLPLMFEAAGIKQQ